LERELTEDRPKLVFRQGGEFERYPSVFAFVVPLAFF